MERRNPAAKFIMSENLLPTHQVEKCELCGRNSEDHVLLRYPFTATYKDIIMANENQEEETTICLHCVDMNVRNEQKR